MKRKNKKSVERGTLTHFFLILPPFSRNKTRNVALPFVIKIELH